MLCVHNLQIGGQSSSRLLSNLKVALISRVHIRFLAKERTDSVCNVGGKLLWFLHKRKKANQQTLKWKNGSELSFLVWLNMF